MRLTVFVVICGRYAAAELSFKVGKVVPVEAGISPVIMVSTSSSAATASTAPCVTASVAHVSPTLVVVILRNQ